MTLKVGIGLLPNQEVREKLISMSKAINSHYPLSYILNGINFHPHLTLFQLKSDSLEDILTSAKNLSGKKIQITLDKVNYFSNSFLFYDCKRIEDLQDLCEKVVEEMDKHRSKSEKAIGQQQNLTGLTDLEIEYLEKYGYPFVKESFKPHFSIGRILNNPPKIEEIRRILKPIDSLSNYAFFSEEAIVYELGVDGSCVNILERFKLR